MLARPDGQAEVAQGDVVPRMTVTLRSSIRGNGVTDYQYAKRYLNLV